MIAADATLDIALRNIRVNTVLLIQILIFLKYRRFILIFLKYRRFNWRKFNSKVITENIIIGSSI